MNPDFRFEFGNVASLENSSRQEAEKSLSMLLKDALSFFFDDATALTLLLHLLLEYAALVVFGLKNGSPTVVNEALDRPTMFLQSG